jgi:hypothetical protein
MIQLMETVAALALAIPVCVLGGLALQERVQRQVLRRGALGRGFPPTTSGSPGRTNIAASALLAGGYLP